MPSRVVLAADTLSIATMELVDNLVMAVIPGAMDAGLVNPVFWIAMMIALTAAFFAAYPVNRHLLRRGKGHALTHGYHASGPVTGARRFIPDLVDRRRWSPRSRPSCSADWWSRPPTSWVWAVPHTRRGAGPVPSAVS